MNRLKMRPRLSERALYPQFSLEGKLCLGETFGQRQRKCSFFIYIDEAESLTEGPGGWDRRIAYHLDYVLDLIRREPVFTLFLSINSRPATSRTAARDWWEVKLIPPFTELPFDIFAQKMRSRLEAEREPLLSIVFVV